MSKNKEKHTKNERLLNQFCLWISKAPENMVVAFNADCSGNWAVEFCSRCQENKGGKKTFSTNLLSKWFSLMTLIWQNQNFSGNWIHSNKWGAWNNYRPLSTFLPSLSFAKPIQNRYFSAVIMCLLLRLPWTSFPLDCVVWTFFSFSIVLFIAFLLDFCYFAPFYFLTFPLFL